jgi:hypothetical protein
MRIALLTASLGWLIVLVYLDGGAREAAAAALALAVLYGMGLRALMRRAHK